jgi:hypothetical protein
MTKPKGTSNAGRKQLPIDWETAQKLASIQCTGEEVAAILEISYDTLERAIKRKYRTNFAEWYKKYGAQGKASLRRKQYQVAMQGNTAMLIFLGKNLLDQSDNKADEVKESIPLPWNDDY